MSEEHEVISNIPEEEMINFHLPDYHQHFQMNYLLATLMRDCPQYFPENIRIGSIYGSFPNAIWNGGRTILGGFVGREDIINAYKAFNELGIPLRHTYTNSLIKGTMVYDTYCNMVMELGHNGLNEVLVNSEELEDYIRKTYPKYPVISSTTKRLRSVEKLSDEVEKEYKYVVIDYTMNKDPSIFLLDHKEKYEILIDAYCCDNCPHRTDHYTELATDQINFGHIGEEPPKGCQFIGDNFYQILEGRKSLLTREELYGTYYEMGFRNFKIEGRTTNPFDVLESYMYYMVLPEYRDLVRLMMLKQMFAQPQPQQQIMVMSQEQIDELQKNGQLQPIQTPQE